MSYVLDMYLPAECPAEQDKEAHRVTMEYIWAVLVVIIALILVVELAELGILTLLRHVMRRLGLYGRATYQERDEELIGSYAEVLTPFQPVGASFAGHVKLNGVQWQAVCRTAALLPGTIVTVSRLSNLTLEVEPKHTSIPVS